MADKFAGKVAILTGGSTGMGLATAKRFIKEGMEHVFITGRRKDALDRAAADIGKNVKPRFKAMSQAWPIWTVCTTRSGGRTGRSM